MANEREVNSYKKNVNAERKKNDLGEREREKGARGQSEVRGKGESVKTFPYLRNCSTFPTLLDLKQKESGVFIHSF